MHQRLNEMLTKYLSKIARTLIIFVLFFPLKLFLIIFLYATRSLLYTLEEFTKTN